MSLSVETRAYAKDKREGSAAAGSPLQAPRYWARHVAQDAVDALDDVWPNLAKECDRVC